MQNYITSGAVRVSTDADDVTDTMLPSELTLSQLLRLLYEQYLAPCGDTCLTLSLKHSTATAGVTAEACSTG